MIDLVATDQEPTLAGVGELIAQISAAQQLVELREDALTGTRAIAVGIGISLMLLAATASLVLARRWVTEPLSRLLATATKVEGGADVAFVTELPHTATGKLLKTKLREQFRDHPLPTSAAKPRQATV